MERIDVAAIKIGDVIWSVPRPGRHPDVIRYVLREQPWRQHVGGTQGFVTNKGRFVEREEARKIAEAAGQLIPSDKGPDGVPFVRWHSQLFSEDVW